MSVLNLRDYQRPLYENTRNAFRAGHKRVLCVLPCGGGKSYLFAAMAQATKGETLILTHRQELKAQHEALLKELGITNTRIAMVITEANHLGEYDAPRLIITDEAHLSRSNSWMRVLDYYNTYTVGFTATPVRMDGKPLGDIYTAMVQGVSVRWLIEHKHLAPYEYYAPVEVETDNLRVRGGDFLLKDLERIMQDSAIYSNAVQSWERLAKGEKTIAYCVSVEHARETARRFHEAGYTAAELDGGTLKKQREAIMQDFRDGKITILCNVGIISEGVSVNDVSCCLLLRPTQSHALYWQQAMRCMRYLSGKTAKIIDCVGNYTRNPMPDADVEWSLSEKGKCKPRLNEEGNFFIRTCKNCFMTFKTAPVCPFCGTTYELHPREIKAHEDIELKRITAEEQRLIEKQRKQNRQEQGKARTFPELVELGKQRGYKNPTGWAYMVLKGRGT